LALSTLIGIVWFSGVVKIEVPFDPLAKLEVILIFGFYELVDLNMPLDPILIKRVLQNLIVLNVFIIKLSAPLDFCKIEATWVDRIHNLAVNRSSGALLDFSKLDVHELVHPLQYNALTDKEGTLHHSDIIT
jgi:hypothetical protein